MLGCGVAQYVVRRLAVSQTRVRFSARHPVEASLAERGETMMKQEDGPWMKDEKE